MPKSTETFVKELMATIQSKRSFGGHPLWKEIAAGKVSKEGLKIFAQQFFLQVREFPRAVSAMHANCPYADARVELAESLYEEETGQISGCGLPHPELFIKFGEAVGLKREEMLEAEALPGTAALIHWFETSTKNRSFLEGAAAINLAAEGRVPLPTSRAPSRSTMGLRPKPWRSGTSTKRRTRTTAMSATTSWSATR